MASGFLCLLFIEASDSHSHPAYGVVFIQIDPQGQEQASDSSIVAGQQFQLLVMKRELNGRSA